MGKTNIRQDIVDVIESAFPDGILDMSIDFDGSYFRDVYPKLKAKLLEIKGACLNYERNPEGGLGGADESRFFEDLSEWDDETDSFEDLQVSDEFSSSYHLFFLGLTDEKYKFMCEDEELEDETTMKKVEGVLTIGCSVGVSLLAPFAIITLDSMEVYESSMHTIPDIEQHIFDQNGGAVDPDEYFRDMIGKKALQALHFLRIKITSILESFGIALFPVEEAHKTVSWLKAGEGVFVGKEITSEVITVRQVLFFRGV